MKYQLISFLVTSALVFGFAQTTFASLPSLTCSAIVPSATNVTFTLTRGGGNGFALDLQLNLRTGNTDLVFPAYFPSGVSAKTFTFGGLTANKQYSVFVKENGPFTVFNTKLACDFFSKVGGATNTTTISNPISASAKVTDKTAEISITYDVFGGPGIDSVSAVVRGNIIGMGGGAYVYDLGSFNPSGGRIGESGKVVHGFEKISDLVPSTKYSVTITAKSGTETKYTKVVEFTTKNASATSGGNTSGTASGTTPTGTGSGTTPSAGGSGGAFDQGQSATTDTPPGGLVGCEGAGCSFRDMLDLIRKGLAFVIRLILPIGAIVFAYVGFLFLTSGGNPEVRSRARDILKKVIIGLVLILCAGLIVGTLYRVFGVKSCYNWLGKEIKDCTSQSSSQHIKLVI